MANRSFVAGLSKKSRETLDRNSTLVTFRKRDELLRQGEFGDFALLIEQGWVKVTSHAANGTQLILAVRGPGDLVGELAAFDRSVRSANVVALGPVRARRLPGATLRALVDGVPGWGRAMIEHLMSRQRHADTKRSEAASSNTVQRVAWQLLELAALDGKLRADGAILLVLRLTRPELAAAASVSLRQLYRALDVLSERGMVICTARRMVIEEPAGLRALAEEPREGGPAEGPREGGPAEGPREGGPAEKIAESVPSDSAD